MDRFPEVLGFGFVVIVPAAELPAFSEQRGHRSGGLPGRRRIVRGHPAW